MRKLPGLLSGGAIAARIGVYIGQLGTPCTLISFQPPTFSAKGLPGPNAYQKAALPITVMFQFGADAEDAATALGLSDEQVAIGYAAAKDDGRIRDRDFLKDDKGQFWLVRDIPDAQPLGAVLGIRYALVRTTNPPAGVS